MADSPVRVGLIGAGLNARKRHIPDFQEIDGVEIVAVANRTTESAARVAEQFQIPRVYANWQELLQDDGIDAVCIGTWPYMHRTLTLAALAHGKHVLCEARMASTAREARDMLDAARANPHLVTQLVPAPFTFGVDNLLRRLVTGGYLGKLLAVELQTLAPDFIDFDSPINWWDDRDLNGCNILGVGAWYEALIRWVGPAVNVMAMTQLYFPDRRDETGKPVSITVPNHVDIICELANRAQAHLRASAVTGLSSGSQVWLYGADGTVHLDQHFNVYGGRRGDEKLSPIPNPSEMHYAWRVEDEFIGAIRGQEPVVNTTFAVGLHYMEFTEAVTRSAQTGRAIPLPLLDRRWDRRVPEHSGD